MGQLEAVGTIARTSSVTEAVLGVMDAVLDAAEAGGPLGVPAGHIYIALQTVGCNFDQFSAITEGLVKAGLVTSKGHIFRITEKGREWLKARTTT